VISKALDKVFNKLPAWAQWIFFAFGIVAIVYGIARYGPSFLLRVIFSP
jgi:hypothetical protein